GRRTRRASTGTTRMTPMPIANFVSGGRDDAAERRDSMSMGVGPLPSLGRTAKQGPGADRRARPRVGNYVHGTTLFPDRRRADMTVVGLPRVEVLLGLLLVALPRLDTIDRVRRCDGCSRRDTEAVHTWKTSSASRGSLTGRAIFTE